MSPCGVAGPNVTGVRQLASITTPAGYGPALDNIAVIETAPTGANCKKGGWQTMLDTSGNMFKNQGDCVSFFATDGKNLGSIAP